MSVGAVNKQTGDRIPTAGMPAIDNALDLTSVNPVQNAVITAALAGKTDTGIVADDFDSTASYVIGNYCIKDGKLYRFKANHSGAWAAADVDEIQITGELATLKSGLTNVDVALSVPEGSGKNVLPMTLAAIKAANTVGTWSGNAYTVNGVTFTVQTDGNENVVGITASGTASANADFYCSDFNTLKAGSYVLNGCASGGSEATYFMLCGEATARLATDTGNGNAFTIASDKSVRTAIRVYSGYEITGTLAFQPMIRPATITDPTFAPYIPSVESRIEAVESKLTSYTKLFETSNSGTYRDKFNSMHATINALSYHDKVASFIDFNGTICRFTDISGTIYTYVGTYWSSGVLKSRVVSVDSQYSAVKIVSIDTTGTTVTDENSVEDTKNFALYL